MSDIAQVKDIVPRIQYTATGGQTVFVYPFPIFAEGDIVVEQNGTVLTLSTDYTVSGVAAEDGGNITLTSGATAGDIMTIYRDMALERLIDYQQNGDFLAANVNRDFDRLWLAIQQLQGGADAGEGIGRAWRATPDDTLTDSELVIAPLATRSGRLVGFDSNGKFSYATASISSDPSQIFSSVLAMQNDTNLTVGQFVRTVGYQSPGDGGANNYEIVAAGTGTADGGSFIDLPGTSLQAKGLFPGGKINVKQFGAVGDGVTDDQQAIQAALDTGRIISLIPEGTNGNLTIYSHEYPLLIPNGGGFTGGAIRSQVRLEPKLSPPAGELWFSVSTEFDEFRIDDPITTKTGAYAGVVGDCIKADTSGGAFSITLPAAPVDQSVIKVKKVTSDVNYVTIAAGAGDTVDSASQVRLMHQNFLHLRYIASANNWVIDIPQSVLIDELWVRGDDTANVRGIKLEGAQFWEVGSLWIETMETELIRLDSVSDPVDATVMKNCNLNKFGFVFARDCSGPSSRAVYVGGTEAHLGAGGARGNVGSSDNNTFDFLRCAESTTGLHLEAGTGNHFGNLNLNNNTTTGGLVRFYGNHFGMVRLEDNGTTGLHFEDLGDGLTDRNFVSSAHNAGGQTNLVVDDNGTNWWPYVDIGRFTWFLPESSSDLSGGATATLKGSIGRDQYGFRFYEEEFRISGAIPTFSVERQGASIDSVRATHALRSTNRALGNSAEWGFFGSNGEFAFTNSKTGPFFSFDSPVKTPNYTVAGAPAASVSGSGAVVYVTNGDAGSPCLAVSDGSTWRRISLGATISSV